MTTSITNENIKKYVANYINNNKDALPDYLRKIEIGKWDVSKVTNMDGLFRGFEFNEDISGWDVSNVTSMRYMFEYATSFNQPIGEWNVSKVENMGAMFEGATSFNQPIGGWNVSNVKNMHYMFYDAESFNQPIGGWKVSKKRTDMSYMFAYATSFNQAIGEWNVSNVTDMSYMFQRATSFNQPIGDWDVSNVTDMSYMFEGATSFNQPIGKWNVSNVTEMSSMFARATSFNQAIDKWDVSNVKKTNYMFSGATSFSQPIPRFQHVIKESLFKDKEEFMMYTMRCGGIKIVRTKKEYMETCIRDGQPEEDCIDATSPIYRKKFIESGRLTGVVMFHKVKDSGGKEIWVHPIPVGEVIEQLNHKVDTCAVCRAPLGITDELKKNLKAEVEKFNAIKLQSILRGHFSRKSSRPVSKKLSTRGRSNSEGSSRLSGGVNKKRKSVRRKKRLHRVRRLSRR